MPDNSVELWEVMGSYNLDTISIDHFCREVYRVETNKGPKALKICDRDQEKVSFIYTVMQHAWDKGFKNLSKPISSAEGAAYVNKNGKIYFLADWVTGRQSKFDCLEDLLAASKTLSEFHNVSFGLNIKNSVRCMSDRWMLTFDEGLQDLKRFYENALEQRTVFGEKFLECYEHYVAHAQEANNRLLSSGYDSIAAEALKIGFFTHRDVAGRNFIMVGKEAHLIDFDYARFDIRHTDLVRIIERGLRLHDWSTEVGEKILETYNKHSNKPLSQEDYQVILAFLIWPQKFWRLCSRYFIKKRDWKEENFVRKLNSLMKKDANHQEFIAWFEKNYAG